MPTEKKKERNRINVVQFDEGVHLQQNYQGPFWIPFILLKTENNKIIKLLQGPDLGAPFTIDVSKHKPNRPNTMNLVEKWA